MTVPWVVLAEGCDMALISPRGSIVRYANSR
jgi:hypothetical protein